MDKRIEDLKQTITALVCEYNSIDIRKCDEVYDEYMSLMSKIEESKIDLKNISNQVEIRMLYVTLDDLVSAHFITEKEAMRYKVLDRIEKGFNSKKNKIYELTRETKMIIQEYIQTGKIDEELLNEIEENLLVKEAKEDYIDKDGNLLEYTNEKVEKISRRTLVSAYKNANEWKKYIELLNEYDITGELSGYMSDYYADPSYNEDNYIDAMKHTNKMYESGEINEKEKKELESAIINLNSKNNRYTENINLKNVNDLVKENNEVYQTAEDLINQMAEGKIDTNLNPINNTKNDVKQKQMGYTGVPILAFVSMIAIIVVVISAMMTLS